jgi:hypothetical protein
MNVPYGHYDKIDRYDMKPKEMDYDVDRFKSIHELLNDDEVEATGGNSDHINVLKENVPNESISLPMTSNHELSKSKLFPRRSRSLSRDKIKIPNSNIMRSKSLDSHFSRFHNDDLGSNSINSRLTDYDLNPMTFVNVEFTTEKRLEMLNSLEKRFYESLNRHASSDESSREYPADCSKFLTNWNRYINAHTGIHIKDGVKSV